MPRTKKIETVAEKAGLPSVEEKAKEIAQVIGDPVVKKERKKRVLTEEQKQVLRERLIKARAVRAEKRTNK